MRLIICLDQINLIFFFRFVWFAAPEAILEADGGTLTDIHGDHYQYGPDVALPNKLGVIATAKGVDHQKIIDKIPADVKQKLGK